jgi:CxxC motif-containing protein (DUF1111 family)
MKGSFPLRYFVIALVAFVPLGWRLVSWRAQRSQPVDASMAQAGQTLFVHEWKPNDPLANGGDGLGPVFNARSCVACHLQNGVGGSGGVDHNVTTFAVRPEAAGEQAREGVVHGDAVPVSFRENLHQIDTRLPVIERPPLGSLIPVPNCGRHPLNFPQGVHVSQRNTPALFGAKLIDEIPDRVIIAQERSERLRNGMASSDREDVPVGRALRLAGGRIGHFGWKAQSASLLDFVQAACANELGLSNPEHPQPHPLGKPDYQDRGLDLTLEQCTQLTAFVASLPRPVERIAGDLKTAEQAHAGKVLFSKIGCAECHTPDLGSVEGLYSDLLLHQMGELLIGGGSYHEPPLQLPRFKKSESPQNSEWRTPPLWGVADSVPYMHDGRANTLEEAIGLHGGQGADAANNFRKLTEAERKQVIAFLNTLKAP